ncbi:MAG: metalloregulator ArsR/SmtB family transcription factor [Acidobacteriota bacterium]
MVNYQSGQLDSVFAALSDATRRGILVKLAEGGEVAVGDLAEDYTISAPAISKHLRVLEKAGLITRERLGRFQMCRVQPVAMAEASSWLQTMGVFWNDRFDALAQHLAQDE